MADMMGGLLYPQAMGAGASPAAPGLLDLLNPQSATGMQLSGLFGGLNALASGLAAAGAPRPVGQPGPSMADAFGAYGQGQQRALMSGMQTRQLSQQMRQEAAWKDAATGTPTTPEGRALYESVPASRRNAIFQMGPQMGMEALKAVLTQRPVALSPGQRLAGLDGVGEQVPYTPADFAYRGAGASRVSVNNPQQIGTIPPGHRVVYDAGGRVSHFEVIPGSPTDREIAKETSAAQKRAEFENTYGRVVLDRIADVRKLAKGAWLPVAGLGGTLAAKVPGTAATDVRASVDTIKANIGFDRLQRMREASPTGGALGQVAVKELDMLQATLGNLAQEQSPEQFMKNLDRIEKLYGRYVSILAGGDAAAGAAAGAAAPPAAPAMRWNPQTQRVEPVR